MVSNFVPLDKKETMLLLMAGKKKPSKIYSVRMHEEKIKSLNRLSLGDIASDLQDASVIWFE